MRLINNVKREPWWVCGRCGNHYHLSQLRWQNLNGDLFCTGAGTHNCFDNPRGVLYSQRQAEIAKILAQVPRYGEPEFDPRLVEPDYAIDTGNF